jgi:hypothetical protein
MESRSWVGECDTGAADRQLESIRAIGATPRSQNLGRVRALARAQEGAIFPDVHSGLKCSSTSIAYEPPPTLRSCRARSSLIVLARSTPST